MPEAVQEWDWPTILFVVAIAVAIGARYASLATFSICGVILLYSGLDISMRTESAIHEILSTILIIGGLMCVAAGVALHRLHGLIHAAGAREAIREGQSDEKVDSHLG